jgi:hypothetical protein
VEQVASGRLEQEHEVIAELLTRLDEACLEIQI